MNIRVLIERGPDLVRANHAGRDLEYALFASGMWGGGRIDSAAHGSSGGGRTVEAAVRRIRLDHYGDKNISHSQSDPSRAYS